MLRGNWSGKCGGGCGRPGNLGMQENYPTQQGNMGMQQNFPTQYEHPRVSPTREYVQMNQMNTVVPHVHPSHLTTINHHHIEHQHHFPHTQSVKNFCTEEHVMCGHPWHPKGCGCNSGRGW